MYKQLNKHYYKCLVSGFMHIKIDEDETTLKLEAVANKHKTPFNLQFSDIKSRKGYKNMVLKILKKNLIKD